MYYFMYTNFIWPYIHAIYVAQKDLSNHSSKDVRTGDCKAIPWLRSDSYLGKQSTIPLRALCLNCTPAQAECSLVKSKVLVNDNLKVVSQNKRHSLPPDTELDLMSV